MTISPDTRKKYLPLISTVFLATFMSKLDTFIVNISLPGITRHFDASPSEASLVVLAFLLFSAGTMLVFGRLADSLPLKKLFTAGYWLFTLSSLACARSTGIYTLVLGRCAQGVGSAMLLISAFALVPRLVPPNMRGWAFGLMAMGNATATAIGLPLGGFITTHMSWRWIFLINVPIGIYAVRRAKAIIPESATLPLKTAETFDYAGAALSFCAISLLLYALDRGEDMGWVSPVVLSCAALGIILLWIFYRHERKTPEPVLPPSLFRHQPFREALAVACVFFGVLGGANFIAPFFLEYAKKLTPDMAGLTLMLYPAVHMVVAPRAGRLSDRLSPRLLCAASLATGCVTFAVFALTLPFQRGMWPVIVFLICYGLANALFISPSNNLVMNLAPEHSKGSAAGVYNTLTTISMAIGVAIFGTTFSASLPGHQTRMLSSVAEGTLLSGFRSSYLIASLLLACGFILSVHIIGKSKEHQPHAHPYPEL